MTLGDAGLEDPQLRSTITSILQDANWDAVIASDISQPDGKAFTLDKELGGEYGKHRLSQTIATAIFMYSHSGGAERSVGEGRLRLALLQPESISPALISDALSRMKGRLYYLYLNGGWAFKAQPNLNAVLSDRMTQVKANAVQAKLKEAVAARGGTGLFRTYLWPDTHKDVPDNHQLKLVLFAPVQSTDDKDELERAQSVIQNNHASGPRINKNTLIYLSGKQEDFNRALEAARTLLALEDIQNDRGLILLKDQRDDLQARLKMATERLPEMAKACYGTMLEPYDAARNEYRVHDLSAQAKTQASLISAVVEVLKTEDRLLEALDPGLIIQGPWNLWPKEDPFLDLKSLREYFQRFPHLPMLEGDDVLASAIVRGVRNGLFELALKSSDDYSQVWRRENPPSERDFFFQPHYLLARLGAIPRPEPTIVDPGPTPPAPGRGGSKGGIEPDPGPGPTPPPPIAKTHQVRLTFRDLHMNRLPQLVDVAGALEDARGKVQIQVVIAASNPQGLDETALELNVREVLTQHGLEVEWEES